MTQAWIKAGGQAGYELTGDHNGEKQEGFGPFDATIWKGKRWSAASAYLRPAQATGHCDIVKGFAARVVMQDGRATGVELTDGRVIEARAEVIIAASAINSPKLLMLSGIGPAAHLAHHGIDVVADRAGVGQNLQDHLELYVQMAGKGRHSLYKYWRGTR